MRPLRLVIVGLAVVTALSACAHSTESGGGEPQPTLAGSSWVLSEVAIDGTMTAAVDASASINFDAGGALFGSTGCNRYTGNWTLDGSVLTLDPGATTMMACAPDLQAQEAAVLAALAATTGYSAADQKLTLKNADGNPMAVYKAAVTDLGGTSWTATGVNNGKGAVVTTAATSDITLAFNADGTVSGFGGCTGFSGTYAVEGAGITFAGVRPASECTDTAAAAVQQEYLAALASSTNFSIDGTRLDLRDDAGALQVGFTSVA